MSDKVFVIDLPVHVVADSADLAREHLARICDRGPVRLSLTEASDDAVVVLYVNFPEDRGHDGEHVYNVTPEGRVEA